MKFAYADPPYLDLAVKFYGEKAAIYDTLDGHRALFDRLVSEFPDGWAYSLHSPAIARIMTVAPPHARVGAWVKPFCSFKPGVNPAFAWEPLVFAGGRKRPRSELTVRDYVDAGIALKRGFKGAKPEPFCFWVFDLLNLHPDDTFVDLFPGSGAVTRAWEKWRRIKAGKCAETINLFDASETE